MTRRARVRSWGRGYWHVCHEEHGFLIGDCITRSTWRDAMDAALVAVGLASDEKDTP